MATLSIICAADDATADRPVKIVTGGWNAPTLHQLARDGGNPPPGIDGAIVQLRTDGRSTNPMDAAWSPKVWSDDMFDNCLVVGKTISPLVAANSYLLVSCNPGEIAWTDAAAWEQIVEHFRAAVRIAAAAGLAGIWLDPEPYHRPASPFDPSAPANELFGMSVNQDAARRRGRQVIAAIGESLPDAQIASCFWCSYLVRDHQSRGRSPIGEDGRRAADFDRRLAAHDYGLLPAFLSGMLSGAGPGMAFWDGCEDAYWMTDPAAMERLAGDVRTRGRLLVDAEVRDVYDTRMRVAMPVFVDIAATDAVPRWTLFPARTDRATVFAEQLRSARNASDGLVWLYGERGRWWPPAGETAVWDGKDEYPAWDLEIEFGD